MEEATLDNLTLNLSAPMPKYYQKRETSSTEQCTLSSDAFDKGPHGEDSSIPVAGMKEGRNCPTQRMAVIEKNQSDFSALEEIGPDCQCIRKCFQRIGTDAIQKIFRNFRAMTDCKSQNAYLCSLMTMIRLTEKYKRTETRRNFTILYHVEDRGRKKLVCKKAFLNIHGLHRNHKRVIELMDQMKGGERPQETCRLQPGRHRARPSASADLSENERDSRLHIEADSSNRTAVYGMYLNEYCRNNKLVPVPVDKFRCIWKEEGYAYNL